MSYVHTTRQYFGSFKDMPAKLGEGSIYVAVDTQQLFYYDTDNNPIESSGGGSAGNFLDLNTLQDQVVAGPVEFLQDITVPTGSVILGKDGARVSSAAKNLLFTDPRGLKNLFIQYVWDETGSEKPIFWDVGAVIVQAPVAGDVDGTIIQGPTDLAFSGAGGSFLTTAFWMTPTATGVLRIESWIGSDDSGAKITDALFPVTSVNITGVTKFELPAPTITVPGDLQYVRFSGVPLHGGLQSSGQFAGQVTPNLFSDVQLLQSQEIASTEDLDTKLDSVQAGMNVTVDNTDPNNPIINATGDMGVASLSGDGVDNTDPVNPVMSFPNPGDIGAAPVSHTHTESDITDLGTYSTDIHANIADLDNVSGTNTGDQDLSGKADKSNVLELDNTDVFTPDADYEPATKKYVDDNSVGYILATWGANIQTLGRHPAINSPSNAAEITSLGIMASIPVPATGTLDTITYYNTTGDNTTTFQVIKNGAIMHTFTCIGPYGVETNIGLPVGFAGSVPDNIAIRYFSGTAPGPGLYTAYVS